MDNTKTCIHKNIKNNTTDAGIYKIICNSNNRFYIGSSLHIVTRIRTHFNYLKCNKHTNKNLQNSYNKYGVNGFRVECIESVDKHLSIENLILLEQKYLDLLTPWKEEIGFNCCKIAAIPPLRAGAIFTEKHKRNIAKAQKERHKQRDPNYTSPLKGKTAKEIHGSDWIDPRKGRKITASVNNGGKRNVTPLTLIHVQTNNIVTKAYCEWKKEGIDVNALKCDRQTTSKHWALYNSGRFP